MQRYRRAVFLIHGINSTGEWYKGLREVLEPHYRCVPILYRQLRRLGCLKILNAWFRRRALKTAIQQYSALPGEYPHVIAHSFGTWIAANLMKRPSIRLDSVIFLGCPMPAHYDWERELADNPTAFNDLTNETGLRDAPVAVAGALTRVSPNLGDAGLVGFKGREELVHTGAIRLSCHKCLALPETRRARIHNISWKDFGHSDWFVGNGHCVNRWLPQLWGFPPDEYRDFVAFCIRLAEMDDRREWLNMRDAENDFQLRRWTWTRLPGGVPATMSEYVEASVVAYLEYTHQRATKPPLAANFVRDRAVRLVWLNIVGAIIERTQASEQKREQRRNIVLRMHPQVAISHAIKQAAMA
jgi:pimeloyl-ACP methyl ester carboxylesterase